MSRLLTALAMHTRIDRAIRGKLSRLARKDDAIVLKDVERWALARYPDHLDEAYTRRLVREIAEDWAVRSRAR
jgi:hypothetical protein